MFARLVFTAIAAGQLTGCYDVPRPECGFACGPAGACPADYSCNATDQRCHLIGSSPNLVCPGIDGGFQPDVTSPQVLQLLPAPDATGVPTSTSINVEFSEDVIGVNATNFNVIANGQPIVGDVVYENTVPPYFARFVPAVPFDLSATVTVTLTSGIRDLFGNRLAPTSWSFTIAADETPPQVTVRAPADGAIDIPVTTTVRAFFTEQVAGVSEQTFTLQSDVELVTATVSYDAATMSATLTPTTPLWGNTQYVAELQPGVFDLSGNPLFTSAWTFFTAADATPPMITDRVPADAQTSVVTNTTVTVFLDEPVVGADTTTFTLAQGATSVPATVAQLGPRTLRLTPDAQLAANTTYTVTLTTGITDRSTNPIAGAPVTWSFTTAP